MLRFESEPACPSKLLIARCYSTIRARIRPNGFERILAHRIGCQRATASLSSRVASKQLDEYRYDSAESQQRRKRNLRDFHKQPWCACKRPRNCDMQVPKPASKIVPLVVFVVCSVRNGSCPPKIREASARDHRVAREDRARVHVPALPTKVFAGIRGAFSLRSPRNLIRDPNVPLRRTAKLTNFFHRPVEEPAILFSRRVSKI